MVDLLLFVNEFHRVYLSVNSMFERHLTRLYIRYNKVQSMRSAKSQINLGQKVPKFLPNSPLRISPIFKVTAHIRELNRNISLSGVVE